MTENSALKSTVNSSNPYSELGSRPISAAAPCGTSVRLEPLFDAVEAELAKLDSLVADDRVEWPEVERLCEEILRSHSKDLLAACYLTRALCEVDPLAGLQQGLALNIALLTQHWEDCFPPRKRARGRAAAYQWLLERVQPKLDNFKPGQAHLAALLAIQSQVSELDGLLTAQLGELAPSFHEWSQFLKNSIRGLQAELQVGQASAKGGQHLPLDAGGTDAGGRENPTQEPPRGRASAAAAPASTRVVNTSAAGAVNSEVDVQANYRLVQENLRSLCDYLRHKDITHPEAYRINRFLCWLGVNQCPPENGGVTQLRAVAREKRQTCEQLFGERNFNELLPLVETSISRAPFWLDGHYLAASALEALGAKAARLGVMLGLREFVKRVPKVLELKFSDGVPFASESTRRWIQTEVMVEETVATALALPLAEDELPSWEAVYQQATALRKEKQLRQAFALFQTGCARSHSLREQVFWRYHQARFCYEANRLDLAIPLLESIDQLLQEKQLEDWEPCVSGKIVELLLRCYQGAGPSEGGQGRVDALHARLCRYDLALAYELSTH